VRLGPAGLRIPKFLPRATPTPPNRCACPLVTLGQPSRKTGYRPLFGGVFLPPRPNQPRFRSFYAEISILTETVG
jgi:hypothetical protein